MTISRSSCCLACIFFALKLTAQTFTNNTVTNIPDVNATINIPVTVSGLPSGINAGFGLIGVCLNLAHPYIGELTIVLTAPLSNDSVRLLWHDGGNTAVNSTICVTEAGTDFVASYPAGGTGSYYGEETNNIMNNGRDPNGAWLIKITDAIPNNAGTINSVSISFGNNPPPTHSRIFGCSASTPWGCRCPDGTIDCDLLPDMTNAKAALQNNYINGNEMRFSVATPNIGSGPLEMIGSTTECFCDDTPVTCGTVCPAGQELRHNVYQTIYHRSGNLMTTRLKLAGKMEFHPTHNHIHLDHFTNNSLRIKSRDPNPAHWPVIGSSYKISFCLVNLGTCDSYPGYCVDSLGNLLSNGDIPNFNFGSITGCSLQQGIYPGNVDDYDAGINGQAISLDHVCNGTYYLVSITDPDNDILETDDLNNLSYVPVVITQQPGNCCTTNFYADKLHGIDSLTVQFSDSSVAIPVQWLWDFGDGFTSGGQFPTHTYTSPGNYTVTLSTETESNCKGTKIKSNYISVRSSVPLAGISITVSPNPFSDKIILEVISPGDVAGSVSLYDATGKKLYEEQIRAPAGNSSVIFSLVNKALAKGLYFMKIKSGRYSNVFKLLKK